MSLVHVAAAKSIKIVAERISHSHFSLKCDSNKIKQKLTSEAFGDLYDSTQLTEELYIKLLYIFKI